MNGNPLDNVKRTFQCLQKIWSYFSQKSLLYRTRKGCVLVYMPRKKNRTIESLRNFKVCFAKGKAYLPWLNRLSLCIKILDVGAVSIGNVNVECVLFLSFQKQKKEVLFPGYIKYNILHNNNLLHPHSGPLPQISLSCRSSLGTISNQCSQHFFFLLEFRVSFRTTRGYPSTGSMGIFNNGSWKDLCVANWDVAEKNLVCQTQGYNRSRLGVHSKSGTNSSGNTTYSCEQLTQNCEEKINTEIKCSGIKTLLSPQVESLVKTMSIETSTVIAELNLSLK